MISNRDIGRRLREIAAYLEMEEVAFKPRAYQKAAEAIEVLEEPLAALFERSGVKAVASVPGVGKSIAEKIAEFITSGRCEYLEAMRAKRPVELTELIGIEGLGPRKVRMLYDALGIRNIAELEEAARAGKIRALPRFGEKSEQEILRGLAFLRQHQGRFLLGDVLALVTDIERRLGEVPGVKRAKVAGSILRRKETVGDADVIVVSRRPEKVMDSFTSLPEVTHVYGKGSTKSSVRLRNGMEVDLRVVPEESYGAALNYFTGSKAHNLRMRRIAMDRGLKLNEYGLFRGETSIAGRTEEDIYAALGLPFIPPELREDRGEIEAALEGRLPRLIDYGALKGDLQIQTDWSDGKASIEEMARTARDRGLEYIAITDHTISLAMTGMDAAKLARQMEEIELLDRHLRGIRILKGAEVNILKDGTLDLPDEVLRRLDVVGAAVHSHFHLGRAEMTERICRAMRNPHVDILFHPTGRIILRRDPYPVDIDEVIRVARETGTVLEIDAMPDRLDLKDEHIRKAVEAGVKLVIDTDAHAPGHLACADFGVGQARRGWASADDVVNTKPLAGLLPSLKH